MWLYLQPVHCVCALKLDLTPGAPEKTFSWFSLPRGSGHTVVSTKCRALFPSLVTGVIHMWHGSSYVTCF